MTIDDEVFVGHGVMFINDNHPMAVTEWGELQTEQDWNVNETRVGRRASLGTNSTILGGVVIGAHAVVGAGAVVTSDVPEYAGVAGGPARVIGDIRERSQ